MPVLIHTGPQRRKSLCDFPLRLLVEGSGEENHGGIFFSAGLCVLTQALLANIIPNLDS